MNQVCGIRFGILLRVMPREVMKSSSPDESFLDKTFTAPDETKVEQYIQQIKKQFESNEVKNNIFNFKTQVPGERFVVISHNADEAWNLWGPRQALDQEGQSQFDSGLRERALEVWV